MSFSLLSKLVADVVVTFFFIKPEITRYPNFSTIYKVELNRKSIFLVEEYGVNECKRGRDMLSWVRIERNEREGNRMVEWCN